MSGNDNAPASGANPAAGSGSNQENQGEGNRDAARRYNQDQQEFVQSGKVKQAVEDAKGQDPAEAEAAEKAGKEHAKGFDPEEKPGYHKPDKA
jgi:hypothetical protein